VIELQKIPLSGFSEDKFKGFLKDRIRALQSGLRQLHEEKLPNWRRAYEATPLEKVRSFPFQNASNLVVPVIAIHADTLLSRIMAAIFKTHPIWAVRTVGSFKGQGEPLRDALEEALGYLAIEPDELDLYRVYHEWVSEIIKYGTSVVKSPWETLFETMLAPAGDGSGRYDAVQNVKYDGPRPEKLPFEDFFISPSAKTLESAEVKFHRRRMERWELEERRFRQVYDVAKVDAVLARPDRTSPGVVQQGKEADAGTKTISGYGYAEYDIWEGWCQYRINGRLIRVIASYHLASDTLLRGWLNNYPGETFVAGRMFYRDDMFHGYGFCETLAQFQEEISQIHNQRRDRMTVANSAAWRVNPDSKLHEGYKIFPSAMVPAEKDEIEALQMGEPSEVSIDEERLSLDLAERRSGVSQPSQAAGAGSFNKRGVYTAMGTLSIMQEGNNRTDLNVSDLRYAHTKVGRMIARQFAEFGNDTYRFGYFGDMAERIVAALTALKERRMALPVMSSTASVNREVEKQNDLMLSGVMSRHYQTIAQFLQAASSQQLPPAMQDYMKQAIRASNNLMKLVMRHFGFDEPERSVPEPQLEGNPGASSVGIASPRQPGLSSGPEVAGPGAGQLPGASQAIQ